MLKILILFGVLLSSSCGWNEKTDTVEYKFFVAGHVYGYPGESEDNIGVHPPFKEKLVMLRDDPAISFGVFTGDIVYNGALEKEWDELDQDVSVIGKPVYFAPGNHDIGNSRKRAVFTERYGPSYRSFKHQNDLYIILDPNLDKWNISGEQFEWLRRELSDKAKSSDTIFVFFHQLLWWDKGNEFSSYTPNSLSGRAESINFFTEVVPLFNELTNTVYMFAGDTGVYERGFMFHKLDNITYIASGMGGRKEDNFLVVSVRKDKSVSFDLIALNGADVDALGKLEDFKFANKEQGR